MRDKIVRTKQRAAVYEALREADTFVSAKKLYEMLRQRRIPVSLATTYRLLQAMHREDTADTLYTPEGETLYRYCSHGDHHHHLICTGCHRVVEIEAPLVEGWAARTAEDHGFTHRNHMVEIFGVCEDCSAASG